MNGNNFDAMTTPGNPKGKNVDKAIHDFDRSQKSFASQVRQLDSTADEVRLVGPWKPGEE